MSEKSGVTEVAVLGGGPGGYAAAFRAADLGKRVALIDEGENPGGVCLYRGCIPSKALLHVAKVIAESREATAWGVEFPPPKIDLNRMRAWKEDIVTKLTAGVGRLSKARGVRFVRGRGKFLDAGTLRVERSAGGEEDIPFERAIIAAGARPFIPPGLSLESARLMDSTSALALKDAPESLLVVGGGYIGLEVAAVSVSIGLEVHVLEMEERILQRVTTPEMSKYYHDLHTSRGVHVHTSTRVSGFTGDGRLTGVICDSGSFEADLVIVGIGIIPNVEVAQTAGIECNNGILVDDHCATSQRDIYAAGDCTNHPNRLLDRRLRLESVPNAMEQSRVAAANLCGGEKVYASIPWFWSDQYELKLQMVGFSADGDSQVVRGDMTNDQFAIFYLNDGVLVATDAVNSPKEFMICKRLIGKKVDAAKLADPDGDLKSLLE